MDDETHILKLKAGDRLALNEIYDAQRAPCLHWLSKRHRLNMEDLIDVYQDAMIILYRQIVGGKLDDRSASLKTYLFAICQNLAQKKWSESRQGVMTNIDDRIIGDWQLNVHDHLEGNENRAQIKLAIKQLGMPCSEIVSLFYYHQNSIESIQGKLGYKSSEVVRTQKRRCLDKLRESIKALRI